MTPKRQMLRLLVLILIVQAALPLALLVFKNQIIFLPSEKPAPQERLRILGHQDAHIAVIERPDGRKLLAYDAQPMTLPDDEASKTRPVVLFLHGNAGNISDRAGLLSWFIAHTGARVLMVGYSGYGGNPGSPSEQEVCADALAAYDHLIANGVPASRIIVLGVSIGSGPASYVAAERKVAGLVLHSPLSSLSAMALSLYPWLPLCSLLTRGQFPVADRVGELDIPVLVTHGKRDNIIPFSQGEKVAAAAGDRGEIYAVDHADHNDLFYVAGQAYLEHLRNRFEEWTR
jgi:fermentation-respiration switch protein FrsA (DUF1100 family)